LQIGIDSCVDAVGLLVHFPFVELANQRVAYEVDEIGRVAGFDVGERPA